MRAVLTYHSIDDSGSPISVGAAAFARHVAWLAAGHVRVLPLDELVAWSGEQDAVALTFDDGFRNFATEAWPRLRDYGLAATVFVVTDRAGSSNAWDNRSVSGIPELPLLGWDDVGRLAQAGVAVGSHTRTHPNLTRLAPAELDDELGRSRAAIDRELGRRPAWLAYPYGACDAAVAARAGEWYAGAVTTEHRPLGPVVDRLRVPRLEAWYFREEGHLERWHATGFRHRIWLRRQARRARAIVARVRGAG